MPADVLAMANESLTASEPLAGSVNEPGAFWTCCTPLMKRLKLYWNVVPGDPLIVPVNAIIAGHAPLYDGLLAAMAALVTLAEAGRAADTTKRAPRVASRRGRMEYRVIGDLQHFRRASNTGS